MSRPDAATQSGISDEERKRLADYLDHLATAFPPHRGSLIPILQEAQRRLGYLPREAMLGIARFLGIPEMDVYAVVTFYNQFRLNPPGKHSVRVCMGTACHVKGGQVVLDSWKRRLGIEKRQTTPDREFDLDTVACVGCCAMAPVTVIDAEVQGKMSPTRVDGILLVHQIQKEKESRAKP
ncbi:MAG: NAD(P)H-dependent oxidoreductase subunit E [Chloroflexi bacterium]|nr:NAD(P)H-dependent oxidoreductase subunit E [Chloroflexota bacterium]